jgi:hypothetical protein
LSESKRDTTTFADNDFRNIGIGIIRHNVVLLACQAENSSTRAIQGPSTARPDIDDVVALLASLTSADYHEIG